MEFISYIVCMVIVYQDFKDRTVHLFALIGLFLVNTISGYALLEEGVFSLIGTNLLILIVLIGSLFLYYSAKHKKAHNILDKEFGKGDVLMLIALTPLFLSLSLLFFIIGISFLGITIGILFKIKTIPFAGILAAGTLIYTLLIQLKVVENYKPIQFFNWT